MTGFIIVCAAMVAAALLWIVLPLLRTKSADADASRKERRALGALSSRCSCPRWRSTMYAALSNWDWNGREAAGRATQQMDELLRQAGSEARRRIRKT